MKHYEYWLFDWDGCLARTLEVWLAASKQGLREYGVTPEDSAIARHFGDWQAAAKMGVAEQDNDACMERIFELAKARLGTVALYSGAAELLKRLRSSGMRLAVASATKREALEAALRHNGIFELFDVVLAAEDVVNHKPDPEVITKALSLMGGSVSQAVMVGDSRKDLGAAKNAGCDSILLFPPSHRLFYQLDELKRYQPTYVIEDFADLEQQVFAAETTS